MFHTDIEYNKAIEFIEAVENNDLKKVSELIEKKYNVNFCFSHDESFAYFKEHQTFIYSPLYSTLKKANLPLMQLLIEKGQANINGPIRYEMPSSNILIDLFVTILKGKSNPNYPVYQKMIAYALARGASLNAHNNFGQGSNPFTVFCHLLRETSNEIVQLFLAELLLRADEDKTVALLKNKNIFVVPEIFKNYFLLTTRQPLNQDEINRCFTLLNKLETNGLVSNHDMKEIKNIVADIPTFYLTLLKQLSSRLKNYMSLLETAKKNQSSTSLTSRTLEDITAELQYLLGRLDQPFINEKLSGCITFQKKNNESEKEYQQHLEMRKQEYQPVHLFNFIESGNSQYAIFCMYLYPGIVDLLCEVALHSEIKNEHRDRLNTLLFDYEHCPENEKKIMYTTQHLSSQNEQLQRRIDELENQLSQYQDAHDEEIKKLQTSLEVLKNTVDALLNAKNEKPGPNNFQKTKHQKFF